MTMLWISTYTTFLSVAVYPRKMPVKSFLSSLAHQTFDRSTHTLALNRRSRLKSSFCPYHTSRGVFFVFLWTLRLCKYTTWTKAEYQYFAGNPDEYKRACTVTAKVSFHRSAPPFWDGLSAPVGSIT